MAVTEFFSTLFATAPADFKILTVEKEGKELLRGERMSPFNEDEIKKRIQGSNAKEVDLYFHCGVDLSEASSRRWKRLRSEDVTGVCFLWVDIDEMLPEERLQEIKNDEFAPTAIVCSGNGYHLYWKLQAFTEEKGRAENKNRWLAERFGGDHCVDVARILRIPGSFNCKSSELKPVTLIHLAPPDKAYDFEAFGEIEPKLSLPSDYKELEGVKLPEDFLSDKRFKSARWVVDAIKEPPGAGEDISGRDWRVAAKLGELGFAKEEIFAILTHPTWPIGLKGRDNKRYAQRTAAKAAAAGESLAGIVALLEQELEETTSKKKLPISEIRQRIRKIHADVLQEGGTYRPSKHDPKFGGIFGEKVAEALEECGMRFVYDREFSQGYITDREGGVWEAKTGTRAFAQFITKMSGFSPSQQEFGFISAGLISYIEFNGDLVDVGRWVHYDAKRKKYFILADNSTGKIYSIDEHGNLEVDWNGRDDIFLRPRVQASAPIEFKPEFAGKPGLQLLEDHFVDFIAGPRNTKRFLECFLIALTLCYGSGIRTLPMLHLTGPSGGGKSTTLGCMTNFLFGFYQLMHYTQAGAFRVIPSETLMAHDDREKHKELEDLLLLCATSAIRTMSDVRNPDDIVIQQSHAVNALTSIDQMPTTALRRRTFVLEIDAGKFPSDKNLTDEETSAIVTYRDEMWSGLIPIFSAMIKNFSNGTFRNLGRKVYNKIDIPEFKGLSDFLALLVLVEKEVCKIMGRQFDEDQTIADFIQETRMDDASEILGRDPLVLCLESFFEQLFNTNSREIFHGGDLDNPGGIHTISINRGVNNFQWQLTDDVENAEVEKKLGCKVRGIKASATGWVSIFGTDTRAFAKTINSPTSLGRQFSRVEGKVDFPFYITRGRHKELGRIWNAFQKIE